MEKKEIKQYENEVIIHQEVARLRGRLTTVQSRSMLSILKRANEQVAENPDILNFTIPTNVFFEDIQNKDTAGIKTVVQKVSKHLESLMVQIFEWGTAEKISKAIFIQQIDITEKEVTFKFSDYIREHIKPISNVLIVKDFALIQSFRSEYARQLYKHMMMWEQKQTLYLTVKKLKGYLGVPNTKSYERMDVLKRKVLDIAVKEINEKCPYMDLKYTNRKKFRSRNIEGFDFTWFNKKELEIGDDYLSSLKNFIAYIRENYKGQEIDINEMHLCVVDGGYIINVKNNFQKLNKSESMKKWQHWYNLAKENKLYCIEKNRHQNDTTKKVK